MSTKKKAASGTGDPGDPTPAQQKEHANRQKVAADRMKKITAEREGRHDEPFRDAAATDTQHRGKVGADKKREIHRPANETNPNPDPEPGETDGGGAGVGPAATKGTKTKRHVRK